MLKVCEFVKRRPGMTVEQFQEYWRTRHGPIVARIPGIQRYVQSHPLLGGYRKGPLPYDGVAEIWVEDKDVLRGFPAHEAFQAAKRDESNFIDTQSLVELVVDEHIIKDGVAPQDAIKCIEFVYFREDMSPSAAQAYWREVHGPIAAKIPVLCRYVQSHVRLGAYRGGKRPICDGLAITWFDSVDAMRVSATTEEYRQTRADEPNFIAPGDLPILLTRELVFLP
jgi:uncharacterized protein (TIGR02118 family)